METATLDVVAAADSAVTAVELAARSAAWAGRLGPPFDPSLATLCSLAPAYVAPWLPPGRAALAARTGLWIFAVDAWSDEPATGRAEVREVVAGLRTVVKGAAVRGDTPAGGALTTALAEIRAGVPGPILPWWCRAVEDTLAGILFEHAAARAARPPSLEEYLRHAAASVAFEPLVLALWAGADEPGPPSAALRRPLRDAALAVRLANDLRGYERERAEGSLNAVALGMPAAEAADLRDRRIATCRRALRPLSGRAPRALERQLLWSVRHYQRCDAGHPPCPEPQRPEPPWSDIRRPEPPWSEARRSETQRAEARRWGAL